MLGQNADPEINFKSLLLDRKSISERNHAAVNIMNWNESFSVETVIKFIIIKDIRTLKFIAF